jgi:hypothetical protein
VKITVDQDAVTEVARLEALRHPPRTPDRRAAAHLWVALHTTSTAAAAKRALADFAPPQARADALALLHRLASPRVMKGDGCDGLSGQCAQVWSAKLQTRHTRH